MKILYIAGGNSIHSHRWINWFLQNKNNKVSWISLTENNQIKNKESYKLTYSEGRQYPKLISLIKSIFSCCLKIFKWKPDIIHAHYMGVNGLLALLLPSKRKIFTAWGTDIIFETAGLFLIKRMINVASIITVDAEHMRQKLMQLGADEKKIHRINFGIETDIFTKREKETEFREKLFPGSASNDEIILSLRNHDPIYDIPTLIKAIPIVLSELPETKFAIGGYGPLTDSYKRLAKELEVDKSICFFGKYKHDELPQLLSQASIYVSTSLSDAGIAASTAEAMSCEVPVIISNTGENDTWIENDVNGILFDASDHQALAENINILLKDDSLKERLGTKGREIIIKNNDYNNEMSKMQGLYYGLLD